MVCETGESGRETGRLARKEVVTGREQRPNYAPQACTFSMISDAPRSRTPAEVDDELGADVRSWFAAEVPDIVAGLEASQSIGPVTAAAARQLIAVGRARDALALVLGEVDGSWRR